MTVHKIAIPTPFDIGDVNVYLLRDGDRLTLVDTGTNSREGEIVLERGLAEVGVRVEDLEQIVLTHFHADHAGLLERLVERSGATVYAHPLTHDLILPTEEGLAKRAAFFDSMYLSMGLVDPERRGKIVEQISGYQDDMGRAGVDVVLQEGDKLPGHEKWRVVYTPGHSQDHLSLYREEDGVMVLGDHLLQHISSNAFIEPAAVEGEERPKTLMIYREALRKIYEMDWQVGYPGHFEEIREYRELIDKRFLSQEKRAAKVVAQVKAGKRTGLEVCQALFPKAMNHLPLVMSETLGHLDWMLSEGKITREVDEQGVWLFR